MIRHNHAKETSVERATLAASLPTVTGPEAEIPSILSDPYFAYSYSYPHKSAYAALAPHVPLEPIWQAERRESLFLYVHLPFCEMRCGFCNLFARAGGEADLVDAYLSTVERQAQCLSQATAGNRTVSRLAIGGGTPTYLEPAQLERLFTLLSRHFGFDPASIPTSVETSPKTATADRLNVLKNWGVSRLSMGVQSFLEQEAHAIGRPQATAEVHAALQRIRQLNFPILNIDLIYGQPLQTLESWQHSIRVALDYQPEEIFIYPLYVRAETGLARRGQPVSREASFAQECYRAARSELLANGYEQMSMRYFSRINSAASEGPTYCCQTDGMLGLGCGARSYTKQLHYSSPFAVTSAGVQAILEKWMQQSDSELSCASWGVWLNLEEQQRRFVIQSLLHRDGLHELQFQSTFDVSPELAVPELSQLASLGLLLREEGVLHLSPLGIELSDAVGPALYSSTCRTALNRFIRR